MPRRNRTPSTSRNDTNGLTNHTGKRAFDTKQQAERAAQEGMRYNLELDLAVYQSPTTGKWHLTSRKGANK